VEGREQLAGLEEGEALEDLRGGAVARAIKHALATRRANYVKAETYNGVRRVQAGEVDGGQRSRLLRGPRSTGRESAESRRVSRLSPS
jgi:hypothetical protein